MNLWLMAALGGVFSAGTMLAGQPTEGDFVAGKIVAGQCRTCHGIDGFAKIPIAPHIGGEPEIYLTRQLTFFRDGTREHEMMNVVAKNLSDKQIADVSAWYANHVAIAELTADSIYAPATCIVCHGADGISVVGDAPNLAGETNIYIDTQLKAFRGGKRTHEIMSEIASEMTDTEIRAVADWYGSVKLVIKPLQ